MSSYSLRRRTLRRYVRLILEELECRYVPSLLGLQISLPSVPGVVPPVSFSVGNAAPLAQTATFTPSMTTIIRSVRCGKS